MPNDTTFCAIYHWRLDESKLDQFREGWRVVTELYLDQANSRGSRLHRCEDGTWLAYAQWPSRDAWEAAGAGGYESPGFKQMAEAVLERFETRLLHVDTDLLA